MTTANILGKSLGTLNNYDILDIIDDDEAQRPEYGDKYAKLIEALSIAAVLGDHKLLQIANEKIIMLFQPVYEQSIQSYWYFVFGMVDFCENFILLLRKTLLRDALPIVVSSQPLY